MVDPDKERSELELRVAEWFQQEEEQRAQSLKAGLKILETGLQMDILRGSAPSAALRVLKMARLRHPDSVEERRSAFRRAYVEWQDKGISNNLPFYLKVAEEIVTQGLRDADSR